MPFFFRLLSKFTIIALYLLHLEFESFSHFPLLHCHHGKVRSPFHVRGKYYGPILKFFGDWQELRYIIRYSPNDFIIKYEMTQVRCCSFGQLYLGVPIWTLHLLVNTYYHVVASLRLIRYRFLLLPTHKRQAPFEHAGVRVVRVRVVVNTCGNAVRQILDVDLFHIDLVLATYRNIPNVTQWVRPHVGRPIFQL